MSDTATLAPRVKHNADLAAKFGLWPEYPAVTKQLELVPFNRRALKPYGYNPAICRWGKRIIMAYRYHPVASDWKTKLAMVELDGNFQVSDHKDIALPGGASFEDPHLFEHQGGLWLSWVESPAVMKSLVKYGQLHESKEWSVPSPIQPKYGQNDGTAMEKNWVFYSEADEIRWIYKSPPEWHWPWGTPKGGVLLDKMRFFHATLDNESNPQAVNNPTRRYYIGAWDGAALSSRPILCGSEACSLTETEIKSVKHFKSNVVFVSGAIIMPDSSYILSAGINDCETALLRAKPEDLHLDG